MTKIQITPTWREVKPSGCYVYIHRRKSDGSAFYIGKGSRDRAWQASEACGRSKWWIYTARKHGVFIDIVEQGMTSEDALNLEVSLISQMRERGEKIVNISEGGDGASGVSKSGTVYCSTGEVFHSCSSAAHHMASIGYKNANPSRIFSCAKGERVSSYGLAWSFTETPRHPPSLKQQRRSWYGKGVSCSNGMTFKSLSDASDWLRTIGHAKANPCNIGACCRGCRPTAYGFTWSYV